MLSLYLRPLRWLALVGLATACAPTYQLGLKPVKSTGLFAEGREQAQAVADSVEVRLSFVCYEANRVVFEAEYRNPTRRSLVVDPAAFQYEANRLPAPAAEPKAKRPKPLPGAEVTAAVAAASMSLPLPPLPPQAVAAFDPEPEISALKAKADKEAEKASRFDWLGLGLAAASLATDVASIGKRETAAQYQNRVAIHDAAVAYNVISSATKIEHAVAAEVLQQRAALLQDYALRKVTLEPGQQVRGYLYFPRYDAADGFVLKAPVGSTVVPLEFAQVRTRQ
ncbi:MULTISPECIES: hypothetical protein [Hymenobacter]|uniref:Uncharacterized protein n=1 Tax=Hymenobacter armeniacus TaxID=2771358 RepID=A0ABR8JKX1_9BACT|nr:MULTISPECIES: hypothetical protein [Hymenobacter]MBD2720651.1 hypothetical protein [Hymenobacter armeniacus]MBJ6110017.1 hypothetical protein [Hymenobacter sp. BT523]